MSKARTLADFISDGSEFADGTISVAEVSGAAPLASPTFTGTINSNGNTIINERLDVNKQGEAFRLRTGDASTQNYISIGRTAEDARITMSGGANNAIQTSAAGDLVIGANNNLLLGRIGSPYINLNSTGVVLNELGGSDKDFRVESDSYSHALFVNAVAEGGQGAVGIGTNNPNRKFVVSEQGANGIEIDPNISGVSEIISYNRSTSSYTPLNFAASSIELNPSTGGSVILNQGGNDTDFRVESDNQANMLLINAGADKVLVNTNLTSTQDVEPSVPAPMSVKNGLFLFRDLSTSGNDRDLLNLDTNGGWASTGNVGTYTNLRWSNGASSTMGKIGLRYGSATTETGANSEFAIHSLFHTNYGNSGLIAAFGANQFCKFMGGLTVNENGNNQDFRVESDGNANMLFVDADGNGVGINRSTVYDTFHVQAISSTDSACRFEPYTIDPNVGGADSTVIVLSQKAPTLDLNRYYSHGTIVQFRHNNDAVGSIYVNGTSTTYYTSSDYRLKENVVELTGATDRLKQLQPKRFNFIADADTTVDGFLAHEVQSIVPEAIGGTKDEVDADGNPVYQGIDQAKLVPLLVATIKELEARITALESA